MKPKPKSEEVAELAMILLLAELQDSKIEIAALCAILKKHGVSQQQLRQELQEVRESAAVRRRGLSAFRPIRKEVLAILQSASNVQKLEQASVQGKPQ